MYEICPGLIIDLAKVSSYEVQVNTHGLERIKLGDKTINQTLLSTNLTIRMDNGNEHNIPFLENIYKFLFVKGYTMSLKALKEKVKIVYIEATEDFSTQYVLGDSNKLFLDSIKNDILLG